MRKTVNKSKSLSELLAICSKNKFFEATAATEKRIVDLKFLAHTKLLQKNIEWAALHVDTSIMNNLRVFGDSDFDASESHLSLPEKYSLIRRRDRSIKSTPFKLIELQTHTQPTLWKSMATENEQDVSIELPQNSKSIRFSCFIQEKQGQEYFYRIQRQRKIWWMQFAANPGRFFISKVIANNCTKTNQNSLAASLMAKYPFGSIAVEHIELLPFESIFPAVAGQNAIPNYIVRSSASLELAAIETVLDSIDAGDFGKTSIHRKLAPYQYSVYCYSKGNSPR